MSKRLKAIEGEEGGGEAERELREVLKETDLTSFSSRLVELQLTRLEHFDHVGDEELETLAALSQPAIRRLRAAIEKRRRSRLRSLFKGGIGGSFRMEKSVKRPTVEAPPPSQAGPANTCLISKDQLKLLEKIGEGSFAIVKRAVWNRGGGKKLEVAVKILREAETLGEEMETEVENMHRLQHPNLIRLFGLVFTSPLMMVVDYCAGGSLLERLRTSEKPRLLVSQLIDFAVQISRGMVYLEQMRFIHRDLATRNVLLTDDEKRVKIGDFGLMRALPEKDEHYVMQSHKKVPFAWCPPESLKRRQFSHASDVWSMGVTLWEMFSWGEEPWCGYRGPEILRRVEEGERLGRPGPCPSSLYALLLVCWSLAPEDRPRFTPIKEALKQIREDITLGAATARQERDPEKGLLAMDPGDALVLIEGLEDITLGAATARQERDPEKGLLAMDPGDALVLIEGLPEQSYWLGQSVRSREVGRFARKDFVFKDERAKHREISKPIRASFIHAGHGDASGGDSWGQPDKIDPLILNNPMPLIDLGPTEPTPCLGAQVVDSIRGLNAKRGSSGPLRPPPPNPRREARTPTLLANQGSTDSPADEVDPFAPFDDYGSVYETSRPTYYAVPPSSSSTYYGAVPPSTNGLDQGYLQPKSSSIPEDPASGPPAQETAPTPLTRRPDPPTLSQPAPPALPPTQRLSQPALRPPVTTPPNAIVRPPATAATPPNHPPTPPAAITRAPNPLAIRAPSLPTLPAQVVKAPNSIATPPAQVVRSPTSLTTPPAALMRPPANSTTPPAPAATTPTSTPTQRPAPVSQRPNSASTGLPPPPLVSRAPVQAVPVIPTPSPAWFQAAVAPVQSDEPDPFEVPEDALSLVRKPRYNDVWHVSPTNRAPRPTPVTFRTPPQGSQERPRSAQGVELYRRSPVSLQAAALANPNATVDQLMARLSQMDAQMQRISEAPAEAPSTAREAGGERLNNGTLATSIRGPVLSATFQHHISQPLQPMRSEARTASVPNVADRSVLDQFDPLSSRIPDDAVNAILQECPFASPQRCAIVLKRCGVSVKAAVEELKVEKLVDMGLAVGRNRAQETLQNCNWDVNAAAAQLLG